MKTEAEGPGWIRSNQRFIFDSKAGELSTFIEHEAHHQLHRWHSPCELGTCQHHEVMNGLVQAFHFMKQYVKGNPRKHIVLDSWNDVLQSYMSAHLYLFTWMSSINMFLISLSWQNSTNSSTTMAFIQLVWIWASQGGLQQRHNHNFLLKKREENKSFYSNQKWWESPHGLPEDPPQSLKEPKRPPCSQDKKQEGGAQEDSVPDFGFKVWEGMQEVGAQS